MPVNPVPGDLTPSSGLHGSSSAQGYTLTHNTNVYMLKTKIINLLDPDKIIYNEGARN